MKQKLIALISLVLALSFVLSGCGLDGTETNNVSDEARTAFIEELRQGFDTLYAPLEEDYAKIPAGFTPLTKANGALYGLTDMCRILTSPNKQYELYINFLTTDIAVKDTKTDNVYHSNPCNNPNTKLTEALRKTYSSPISLDAYDSSSKRYSFNFYENCREDGLFYVMKSQENDNSLRIIYTIGNDPDKDLFPPVITESTYNDKIMGPLDKMHESGEVSDKDYKTYVKLLNDCYRFMTPDDITVETKERFKSTFPTIDVMTLYVSYENTATKQKKKIKEFMQLIGFTAKDVKAEMEKADYQGPERSVLYTIPVDITLTDEGLNIDIDSSKILGPTKQRLYSLNLYRGMGSYLATTGDEYIIVPDGSGAVIPAAGTRNKDAYKARVYGDDETFSREMNMDLKERALGAYLIFDRGLRSEATGHVAGGIVALMEEGAGLASAVARSVSGSAYPWATINYEVIYSERDYRTYTSSSTSGMTGATEDQVGSGLLLSKEPVAGMYKLRYLFTEGGMTYAEYAQYLRAYYQKKNVIPTETRSEELPLYLDLLGCVDLNKTVIGIPVTTKTALTGYKQAQEILEKLKEAGLSNVVARYSYWANGGENNFAATDLELISGMGSKAELTDLLTYCEDNGLGIYPSVDFLRVTDSGNGFSKSQDAARRMNRSTATVNERFPATGLMRDDLNEKILVSPEVALEMAESYKASFEDVISSKKIAFADLGKNIHSSYRTSNNVTRLFAEQQQKQILDLYGDYDIAVTYGNLYTWANADYIFGLPIGSSELLNESHSIPFAQMLLHGYVGYSTAPLNLSGDYETALLYILETGAAPCFRWMGAEDSVFDYTEYYNYFSLCWTDTFDRAVELYKKAAEVLNDVNGKPITDHVSVDAYYVPSAEALPAGAKIGYLTPEDEGYKEGENTPAFTRAACGGVFATTYGDSKVILVNYNSNDVELWNRRVVKGRSFEVLTVAQFKAILEESPFEALPEPAEEVPVEENKEG